MAEIKARTRNKLPKSTFGLPGRRAYPMSDRSNRFADYELWMECKRCGREIVFFAESHEHAMRRMHHDGWFWDDSPLRHHLCPDCSEEVASAVDASLSKGSPLSGGQKEKMMGELHAPPSGHEKKGSKALNVRDG